jgi:hypothetical protein
VAQRLRTERTLGTTGAVALWTSGGLAALGYFEATFFVVSLVVAGIGGALLWGERAVARRNMADRLGRG